MSRNGQHAWNVPVPYAMMIEMTVSSRERRHFEVPDLVLYRDAAGRRIDVLFAHTDFERSALSRRRTLTPFGETTAQVVSVEDLVVYKLIADRPQDRADIAAVVEAQQVRGEPIDWAYVERWCDAWEVRDRLSALRAELEAQ